jgi:hypothetical protein
MEYGIVEFTTRAMRAAVAEIATLLKPDDERRQLDYVEAGKKIAEHFRNSLEGDRGTEPLYVASFATARK